MEDPQPYDDGRPTEREPLAWGLLGLVLMGVAVWLIAYLAQRP